MADGNAVLYMEYPESMHEAFRAQEGRNDFCDIFGHYFAA